jgi:hypothetical protein
MGRACQEGVQNCGDDGDRPSDRTGVRDHPEPVAEVDAVRESRRRVYVAFIGPVIEGAARR